YAGDAPPPRPHPIGHRGRFRPYRWVFQRVPIFPVEPWSDFVTTLEVPYRSADELLQDPDLFVQRRLHGRLNAYLRRHRIHVKVFATARQARVEWENHRVLIGAGFLVPRPAVGGVLPDGRGLFSSVRLEGMSQLDRLMPQLDARRTILNVADLCRRLHACGLVHKDLYLCHFFGRPGSDLLGLIDLARVARTRSWRLRVKDLAAVVYSSREIGISWPTLYRGLRRYGGGRLLARAVMRKYRRMRSHVPRNVREGVETLEPPCT
ncbi:MAG: lipopolysaccharide kinase InaA family protein, partial [Planctomycetota bacterium]